MVPKVLSFEQKECRKELCLDLLQCIENEPDLLNLIITCDETWIFTYDPETNRQSMEVNIISKTKKKHKSFEVQGHVVFFDIQGIVMAECVPSGQTVNQQYYTEVLKKFHECVRRKRPELWRNGWILHQDNAPSVKQFLTNKNITVLEHPPYSPDLAPCDFCLFPKINSVLKETHSASVENVKAKTVEILNSLTEHDLYNCF